MPLSCTKHRAFVYDRGGLKEVGELPNISRIKWGRTRDAISEATVYIASRSQRCDSTLALARAQRSELVIFRGEERVWEGVITLIGYKQGGVTIHAKDVVHYIYRTALTQEYDNSYPNMQSVVTRVEDILRAELARKEALSPAINVIPHLVVHTAATDALTTSHTLPYEATAFEHMDSLAWRGGLDYTVVGRALHLFDVDTPLGRTPTLSESDFLNGVEISEYGMEVGTVATVTDGQGNYATVGEADPYYGLVELVDNAYDEDSEKEGDPPTLAEMRSQAQRIVAGRNPAPLIVRVPDNSSLNPDGTLSVRMLVPGVWMPLQAALPGRALSQMQKLDSMTVEETPQAETVKVTLSTAPVVIEGV